VIEIEQVQIHAGDAHQTHPDKLIGDIADLVQTNNLLVKVPAVRSGLAAKNDHHRLAGLPGQGPCREVIGVPVDPSPFLSLRLNCTGDQNQQTQTEREPFHGNSSRASKLANQI
jgi:hypothetical protein